MTYADTFSLRTPSTVKMNDVASAVDGLITRHAGGTSTGTANVQAITLSPVPFAFSELTGTPILVTPVATNTGALTLNPNSLGAKTVQYKGYACVGGEFKVGVPVVVVSDGTNFQIVNHGGGWATSTPTYGALGTGSPTFTSVTTTLFDYQRHGDEFKFIMSAVGTTGGSTVSAITFSIPIAMSGTGIYLAVSCNVTDSSFGLGRAYASSTTVIAVEKQDGSNFGIGANRRIYVTGTLRI